MFKVKQILADLFVEKTGKIRHNLKPCAVEIKQIRGFLELTFLALYMLIKLVKLSFFLYFQHVSSHFKGLN